MDGKMLAGNLTIEDLPSELLFEILKLLDDTDLGKVQQVCSRLHAVVDEWIGRWVIDYVPMVAHPSNPDLRKLGLELISEIGVKVFCVHEDHLELSLASPLPSFKRPYLLRYLCLYGILHPDLFQSLIKDIVNLSELYILPTVLHQVRDSDLIHLKLPRLTKLKVQTDDYNYNPDALNEVGSLPNLRTLLNENVFRQLTCLGVEFPIETFQDFHTIKALLSFTRAHPYLAELEVWMNLSDVPSALDRSTFQDDLNSIIAGINGHGPCPSLKKLQIRAGSTWENCPQLEIWKQFVMQQTSLQYLGLWIGLITNDNLRTICIRNGASLEELAIDQQWNTHFIENELDCYSLAPIKCVHKLTLHGMFKIKGIKHLPLSLVEVFIMGILTSDELNYLLLNLPNLQKIFYFSLNHYLAPDGHSIRLGTLEQFVQNRRVGFLCVNSVGGDFPVEGMLNGDPVNPSRLTISHVSSIAWMLNRDGYYVNAVRSQEIV